MEEAVRSGYGALGAVQGPAPAPLEGEDIFVSDEDPNAKRPRITQGRIDAGASRHEWFEHDGLHATSFGAVGEACTRCVGGAARPRDLLARRRLFRGRRRWHFHRRGPARRRPRG